MPRLLLLTLLLIQSLISVVAASDLVLDLDKPIDTQLLYSSQYYIDTREALTLENIHKAEHLNWTDFNRTQLNLGFLDSPIWIRTNFNTIGNSDKEVVLIMHQVIDHIQLEISAEGEKTQQYTLGKGTLAGPHHIKEEHNLNHAAISLKPGQRYQVLLHLKSANPVIGGLRIADRTTMELESHKKSQWMLTFLLVVFLVSFYNLVIFLSTRNRAFLYHIFYVTSLMCYLLNDHGYISYWFNICDTVILQKITGFSLISAYLSMVIFFNTMNTVNAKSVLIIRLNKLLISGGYLLFILTFIIPYDYLIRLLSLQVVVAIVVGIFISYYREKRFGGHNQTHKLSLRVILISFAPSALVYILNRLGFIDTTWYTEFALFFSTLVEVIVISLILIVSIRESKYAIQRELLISNMSGLPNEKALKAHFYDSPTPIQQTLILVWISGLDRLEIAFGPTVYKQFFHGLAAQIKTRLAENSLLIPFSDQSLGEFPLFHHDKNTLALLCQPLNSNSNQELQQIFSQSIDALRHNQHNSIDLNFAMGAHEFTQNSAVFDRVLRRAQLALSHAIKNNKRFKYYDPQIGFDEQKRIALLNDFNKSLKNDEFFLLWQPQYDTKYSSISGVEVLTRWQHPQYGLVSPDVFIPILERSNRICELSHWVIQQVFAQIPSLHEKHPGIEVSINLSPKDLLKDGLVEFIDHQSHRFAAYIPYITLEITETMMINDYTKVLKTIEQLQRRGFNISIDDFGSGYASFSYLQKLPANELKIDKSYTDCYREETTYAILESIIELAKRLGMRIVVEGVENQQQVDLFTNLGAERLQGWRLDKPMPIQSLLSKT